MSAIQAFTGVRRPEGSPVGQLFNPGLVAGTLLLCVAYCMSLLVFCYLTSWQPTLINSAGFILMEAS
jgi:MFS transporter, AAHS family, 4-hydroxybenzoate transporter